MRNPMIETMQGRLQQGLSTARKLGASEAKLAFGQTEKIACEFEAGRLKETGSRDNLAYHVEVLVDGRRGRASGNRLEDLDAMLERAVALARVGSVAHFDAYPAPADMVDVKMHSPGTAGFTREQMIDSCQTITDALKAYDPQLWIGAVADRLESEAVVATTGGVCHPTNRTLWTLYGYAQQTEDTDILFAWHGRGWCDLNEFHDPDAIADRIIQDLEHARTITESPQGESQAYLPPETLKRFLAPIFMGTNGRNVAKGESPLAGRLGERVLAPALTIEDNPHQDYASGARSIDGDGIPTRKQTIFESGKLRRFLYDLDSAGLAGEEPTGNAGCAPYSVTVAPGDRPSDSLLAGIGDGLYIRNVIGFGQSNITNGDFSCNVSLGYRVRNGRITGRVKDTMVAGNLYELFAGNVRLSSDLDHEGRYPHAVLEGVNVSARKT
jgi:PmbA protein